MQKDLICGMMVDEKRAKFTTTYEGMTYYFCSSGCKATFDKEPKRFIRK